MKIPTGTSFASGHRFVVSAVGRSFPSGTDPAPFPYTQIVGEAASVPGTFDVTFCRIDLTANPS